MTFEYAPTLIGPTLSLQPLKEEDRDALYKAAKDPLIWEMHPATTRYKRDVFYPYFDSLLATPGSVVAREIRSGRVIGTSRFYTTPDIAGDMAIGYTFLTRDHWGGATNREIKALMARHVFAHYNTMWLHIDLENFRSQKATLKLGAEYVDTIPVLIAGSHSPRKRYRLTQKAWKAENHWGIIIP